MILFFLLFVFLDVYALLKRKISCTDNFFEEDTWHELVKDAKIIGNFQTKYLLKLEDRNLRHNKLTTFWWSKSTKPRTLMERVVQMVTEWHEKLGSIDSRKCIGAEWWITKTNPGANVGLHYDKDEGVASTEWWMKFPLRSTITYITNQGAPTLILNQITNRGGNKETPTAAKGGWLSMPKSNRHCEWQGNLHHGVFGGSIPVLSDSTTRYTLAINFWDSTPKYPYSVLPSRNQLQEIGLKLSPSTPVPGLQSRVKLWMFNSREDREEYGEWRWHVEETAYKTYRLKLPYNLEAHAFVKFFFPESLSIVESKQKNEL